MKKSVIYHLAILSVLDDENFSNEEKLEILTVLLEDEKLAMFQEENEVEKG